MTTTRHELPSGHWVDLCEADQIPEKYTRRITRAMLDLSPETIAAFDDDKIKAGDTTGLQKLVTGDDFDVMMRIQDLSASAQIVGSDIEGWDKHPTPDQITDLPGEDYRALAEAVSAQKPADNFDPVPYQVDPDAPTEPSNA